MTATPNPEGPGLADSPRALCEAHDCLLLDLDGVVYLGEQPVVGVADVLAQARAIGMTVNFVTNNASRRASDIVALLASFGVSSSEPEVVTSAQVAARILSQRLPEGEAVLVVGSDALASEVAAVGLRPVREAEARPRAVVQGYGKTVGWEQLAEAALALRAGAWWVATNTDRTVPTPRGLLPGNGAMVAALATATDRHPDMVVGKPEPLLWEHAATRQNANRPLVVGDRLDTDIAGANRAGMASLLVFTGVTTPLDLLLAVPEQRPRYIAADLGGVLHAHPQVVVDEPAGTHRACCGGWRAFWSDGLVRLDGAGDLWDALRALCGIVWRVRRPIRLDAVTPAAAQAMAELGLDVLRSSQSDG